jgi:hypothetical protein
VNSDAAASRASLLAFLPLDEAIGQIATSLRGHAEAEEWSTQEAHKKWLLLLADNLDDCVKEVRRRDR